MGKVNNLVISPDLTYRIRPVVLRGKVYLNQRSGEAIIAEADAVTVNPRPIAFNSWHDFMEAPSPTDLEPKQVSPLKALLLGDNPWLMVTSQNVAWPIQRVKAPRQYIECSDQWSDVVQDAYVINAVAPATKRDNGGIPTLAILLLTAVIVIAVLLFAGIVIQERLL